jgi:hypothetical protein
MRYDGNKFKHPFYVVGYLFIGTYDIYLVILHIYFKLWGGGHFFKLINLLMAQTKKEK